MAVSVNQPQRREEKDPLDTILKGLSIAQGIYGIKEAGDKAALLKQEAAAKRDNEAFSRATGQAAILKAGYEASKQEDGSYALKPREGFRDLETQKTQAEIEKLRAETEKARKDQEGGLASLLKQQNATLNGLHIAEAQRKQDEAARSKTPEGKLDKLTGEARGKVGSFATALETITDYEDAFAKGQRRSRVNSDTPFVGSFISDTDVDTLTRKLSDDIGRMRSGGAINSDEEKRFLGMLPRPGDEDKVAATKLIQLRNEFDTRLRAYGLTPEELSQGMYGGNDRLGLYSDRAKMPMRGLVPIEVEADPAGAPKSVADKTFSDLHKSGFRPNFLPQANAATGGQQQQKEEFDPIAYARKRLTEQQGMSGRLPKK